MGAEANVVEQCAVLVQYDFGTEFGEYKRTHFL
jgi:hypothetical protein